MSDTEGKDEKPREFWIGSPNSSLKEDKSHYEFWESVITDRADLQHDIAPNLHVIEYSEYLALKADLALAVEALKYVIDREDFSFAECSEAEEIWSRCKTALADMGLQRISKPKTKS